MASCCSKIQVPLLLLAAASPSALAAFDLLQMLGDKPLYATFSKLLAQTNVVSEANRLREASLLVVPEKTVQGLVSLPAEKQRAALANHVLLSYFDPIKLAEMKTRTAMLNTLLSVADKRLGVVNYTKADDGQMYLGVPGAPCVAKLVKVVAARPYTVSIMEVSEPILPAGFEGPAAQQGPAGRRAKGGKGKIRPAAASGLEESKAVAAGENPGAVGNAFPDTPAAAAPGAAP